MNLQFFFVNESTGKVLDQAHYTDLISSYAVEAYRAGEFASLKDANSRYFEMDHGYSKYSYDADQESLKEAVKRILSIDLY